MAEQNQINTSDAVEFNNQCIVPFYNQNPIIQDCIYITGWIFIYYLLLNTRLYI